MPGGIAQLAEELRRLLGRQYPGFVYRASAEIADREVPVFVFHRIVEDLFEQTLRYLTENGYNTIGCDEYVDWLEGNGSIPPRSVLLAIDDGHESIWQYGYPLLERYDCRATVFLVAGYVRDRPRHLPHGREPGYYNLVYWEEIEEMQSSERLDFQSHGLFHHQVFDEPEPLGFFDSPDGTSFFDWVLPHGFEAHVRDGSIRDFAGLPIFRHRSYFESRRRFLDDEKLREAMLERVRELGGRPFLQSDPAAQDVLRRVYEELSRGRERGRLQPAEETLAEIRRDLEHSRELIEERLHKPVRHFCFPYSLYDEQALEWVQAAGYRSAFIGTHPSKPSNSRGGNPYMTVRLNNDYLRCLPGRGRRGLTAVLADKVRHRLSGTKVP
jgi:peptidoglycan/xylan/chitin deacetylase (PgdA/CDA1 family)